MKRFLILFVIVLLIGCNPDYSNPLKSTLFERADRMVELLNQDVDYTISSSSRSHVDGDVILGEFSTYIFRCIREGEEHRVVFIDGEMDLLLQSGKDKYLNIVHTFTAPD